ncbi:MAG: stage II sporulation protein R [Oscillospiraceae bacterium]|nr:stage II sporulation protein R [Oscillospiraceae bacterium]
MKRNTMELSFLFAFLLAVIISFCGFETECKTIRTKVLRLHVIAASDSEEDQALKLKVRDSVLRCSQDILSGETQKGTAERRIAANLDALRIAAEEEIQKNGYDYPVRVELTKADFPTRSYEAITLPAGQYNAVRVVIGNGEGKNWWCVMFPPLCLSAAKKQTGLSDVLNKDELALTQSDPKYEIRFWIVEKIEKLKAR